MINVSNIYQFLIKLYSSFQVCLLDGFALPPLHAFFEITYQCNLRCKMCHTLSLIKSSNSPNNGRKELTSGQIKKMIRCLPRNTLLTFTGGEPLLRKDLIDVLTSACKHYKCHIITNGTLLSRETANSLIALIPRSIFTPGLMMIGFSLEGPEDIHDEIVSRKGSFKKTLSAIKLIQNLKNQHHLSYPMIHITTVITNKNISYLSFIYSLAKRLGLEYCNFVLENRSEFTRNQQNNNFTSLYKSPPLASKINPEVLKSQLDQLDLLVSRNLVPKIRFSPNDINRSEIIKYYSKGINYKDYRCKSPWSKIGFSAFGDVVSCPYVIIGNILENNYDILWNSRRFKIFRKKLKKEKSFPCCTGCCQSEYIGN